MKAFIQSLFVSRKARRTASQRRPTLIRPQLETLETRLTPSSVQTAVLKTDGELDLYNTQTGVFQMLSPAGTILTASAAQTASGQTVVFAVAADTDGTVNQHTLWEYTTANDGWSEISTGYFQQVSAAVDATGNAVVFAVPGNGGLTPTYTNTLWEYSNGGWTWLPLPYAHAFGEHSDTLSVSAVGTAEGEVAFDVSSIDHSLWQYSHSSGWSQISTGWFQQVSAGRDANGQANVFGVLGQGAFTGYANSLWEFDNGGWNELAGPDVHYVTPFVIVQGGQPAAAPPSAYLSVAAGLNNEFFGIAIDQTLWQNERQQISPRSFAQVSATQTASGADVVFGTLTDGSLWEYTSGPGVTTSWNELLTGGVASTSTPL